jgi:hypothetical protein
MTDERHGPRRHRRARAPARVQRHRGGDRVPPRSRPPASARPTRSSSARGLLHPAARRGADRDQRARHPLAFASALVIGGFVIALSEDAVREALGYFTHDPATRSALRGSSVSDAYRRWCAARSAARSAAVRDVGVGDAADPDRPGGRRAAARRLFNIGAEGQLIAGGLVAGYLGFAVTGLPLSCTCRWRWPAGILAGASTAGSPASSRRAPARTRSSRRSCSTTSRCW